MDQINRIDKYPGRLDGANLAASRQHLPRRETTAVKSTKSASQENNRDPPKLQRFSESRSGFYTVAFAPSSSAMCRLSRKSTLPRPSKTQGVPPKLNNGPAPLAARKRCSFSAAVLASRRAVYARSPQVAVAAGAFQRKGKSQFVQRGPVLFFGLLLGANHHVPDIGPQASARLYAR
jgi:hypothetical protein